MAATARISKIEYSATAEDLAAHLHSKGLPLKANHPRISLVAGEGGYKIATVSFIDRATLKRALSLPYADRILNKLPFDVDDDFYGFTPLSEGAQVDIVSLHGMNGHAFKSWEYHDGEEYSFMWLRDCLPKRLPDARIMVYGHDASILRDISSDRLRTYAETFFEWLLRLRSESQAIDRPLIFLAYSMGGLILKHAFLLARTSNRYNSILSAVRGVLFLGTPHRDAHILKAGGFILMLAKLLDPSVHVNIKSLHTYIKNLHPNVTEYTRDFRDLIAAKGIGIATVIETKKTKLGFVEFKIVEEQSAILGIPGERKLAVDADHSHLCKFSNSEDQSLSALIQVIEDFFRSKLSAKTVISPPLRSFQSDPPPRRHFGTAGSRSTLPQALPLPPTVAATVRVTNLANSTTEEELRSYFRSKKLLLSLEQAITFTKVDDDHKLTTVSFFDEENFKRALSLSRKERKLNDRAISFDGGFDGFTVLFEGDPCQIDIVALHGMNGHAFNSWEYRDNNGYSFMWLRDYLPERIPKSRIMVYGYNANALDDLSTLRIRSYAETFLEKLFLSRRGNQVADRPLILLGHSLGGLIIKQALIIALTRADDRFDSILNAVGGILFIGTPHRGLNGIDEEEFLANFAGVFNVDARRELIAAQHPSSMALFDLTDDFRQLIAAKDIDIATLYESKRTKYKLSEPVWIVDEQSAILGVAGERKASINADHTNLCKFEDSQDNSLAATIGYIEEFFADVVPRITTRHCSNLPTPPDDLKYPIDPVNDNGDNSYPVLEYEEHWYYALNYNDDRDVMVVVAYNKNEEARQRWTRKGSRSVRRIEYRELDGSRQISFVDQDDCHVLFPLTELKVSYTR